MKQIPGPEIVIKTYVTASVFYCATEVPRNARQILILASNFRTHGANLYELCSNEDIELALGFSHGQFMRSKKQLRDAGLLDYDGNPGDYSKIIQRWEIRNRAKWPYQI